MKTFPRHVIVFAVLVVIALLAAILNSRAANAQWYNYPYAPWRIQPGFRAPPVADPYVYARARSYGLPPPAPGADVAPPVAQYDPAPNMGPQPLLVSTPPLGWIYGPYTVCTDPPRCGAIVISVGADGLNVRMAPNGPVVAALANGVPVIPMGRDGDWMLVAPACALAPTWTFSWTAGVPLSVCL
jgi:hypothetical protein